MRTGAAVCLLAAAGLAPAAIADTVMGIDINSLSVHAVNGSMMPSVFGGLTHTGSVVLMNDGNSHLAAVTIDGAPQTTTSGLSMTLAGRIDLNLGVVSGGFFNISLSDGSTFTANIVSGQGRVRTHAGQGYRIDGLMTSIVFGDNGQPSTLHRFAGVNIHQLLSEGGLTGTFLNFAFSPNANGIDNDAGLDLAIQSDAEVIPLPTGALLAGASLAGLGAIRRRR